MPFLLLSAIGLILFLLFLRSLSHANSQLVKDIFKFSSFTVLGMAVLLFILSGRIPHATILVLILLMLWLQHTYRAKRTFKLLDAPLSREEALKILGLISVHNKAEILEAYEKKRKALPKKGKKAQSIKLRHAKETLLQLLD